jgi:hypothetical protein
MIKIPLYGKLGVGKFALIDDEDWDLVKNYRWYVRTSGYVYSSKPYWHKIEKKYKPKNFLMHRLICPHYKMTDHIHGDKSDNRKSELRECTNQQNQWNRSKKSKSGTSKFKGIYWNKMRGKWKVAIMKDNHSYFRGYFDSEITAARAYNIAAKELFGDRARINSL